MGPWCNPTFVRRTETRKQRPGLKRVLSSSEDGEAPGLSPAMDFGSVAESFAQAALHAVLGVGLGQSEAAGLENFPLMSPTPPAPHVAESGSGAASCLQELPYLVQRFDRGSLAIATPVLPWVSGAVAS